MSIIAQPTLAGVNILTDDLHDYVTRFCLVGALSQTDETLEDMMPVDGMTEPLNSNYSDFLPYIFYESTCHTAFYDNDGNLSFRLLIPYDLNPNKYIYGVGLIYLGENGSKKIVSIASTPKVLKITGVGGSFEYKIAISGEAGKVIYRSNDYVTTSEMQYVVDNLNLAVVAYSSLVAAMQNQITQTNFLFSI